MRNRIIPGLLFAAIIVFLLFPGDENTPRLEKRAVFKNISRGDVNFPHDRHYEWGIGCLSCHHSYKNEINLLQAGDLKPGSPDVSCASCHGSGRDLEQAYHKLCINCHEEMKISGTGSGPVLCGRCHSDREK